MIVRSDTYMDGPRQGRCFALQLVARTDGTLRVGSFGSGRITRPTETVTDGYRKCLGISNHEWWVEEAAYQRALGCTMRGRI